MNTQEKNCILCLADTMNFSKAAKEMNLTQPAFSRIIKRAEEELGLKLFARNTRSVTISEEGRVFVEALRHSSAVLEAGISTAKEIHRRGNSLRIGMATEFVCMDLAPAILKFRDDNPSMMVEVLPVPAGIAPDCLRDSKVDIVFIFTDRTRFSSDFDSRVVKKIPLHWVVNKRNPLAQKEFLCPEDLLGQKIIILETTAGMHEIGTYGAPLRILNQKSGLRLHETKIAQTTQESLVAVACDEGICMLTSSLAHLVPQNCVMLPIDGVDFSLTALWMKRIDSKSIKSFLEYAEVELIR